MKPTLHLVGIFHTRSTDKFSHCAFTGKALRFPKMMREQGWEVVEYSNAGSESQASEHVEILSLDEFEDIFGSRKPTDFFGDVAVVGSPGHKLFESRLVPAMKERVKKQDIICHPFGHAHELLMREFPGNHHVETGIGYPTLMPNSFRIFESYAWMHYHQGKANRNGANYEWVVPNYFDLEEWEPSYKHGDYLAFLGRIGATKGMDTIKAIAEHSPWPIILHGQGDPTPWNHPNIEYRGPIHGKARSEFLRNARAALMPTVFTEPFGGSGVEAMLCGTPLIAVDYGAFTETIIQGVTGFRCHTLAEWIEALKSAEKLDRKVIANTARERYSLETCGKKYDKIFNQLNDLWRKGWYELPE
jgi:glycosyltransferase involved in cell wall biosynthesis